MKTRFVLGIFLCVHLVAFAGISYTRSSPTDMLIRINSGERYLLLPMDDSEFNVEALSGELHVSRAQLFRKTKSVFGVSPVELIRQVQLRKAQELLHHSDLTIQQVAYTVGFTSPSYFSKCYREFFGVSPTAENSKDVQ